MSKVSAFIEAHTNWLNVFLPTFKNIVDVLPIPAPIKADFDMAYAMAPSVIMAGAAAVQEAGGGAQPGATALAGAFGGGQVPQAPAPVAPVQPANVIALPQAPVQAATPATQGIPPTPAASPAALATLVGSPQTAAPIVPPAIPATPLSAAEMQAGQVTGHDLATLAAAMGLRLTNPDGSPVS